MADITVTEFRARFPEFAAESDDDVAQFIATAYILSDVSREATLNLAAHLGTLYVGEQALVIDDRGGTIIEESFGPKKLKFYSRRWTAARCSTLAQHTGGWRWPLRTAHPPGL